MKTVPHAHLAHNNVVHNVGAPHEETFHKIMFATFSTRPSGNTNLAPSVKFNLCFDSNMTQPSV